MDLPEFIQVPDYYDYYGNAYKIVEAPNGGLRGYMLDVHTGRFAVANSKLRNVLFATREDISHASKEEFIRITEESRAYELRGEGPIFALYKIISNLYEHVDLFDKDKWGVIYDSISTIRRRTFELWEEEFARQDAGERPSFKYEAVAGLAAVEKYSRPDPTPDLSPVDAEGWFSELWLMRQGYDRAFLEGYANGLPAEQSQAVWEKFDQLRTPEEKLRFVNKIRGLSHPNSS